MTIGCYFEQDTDIGGIFPVNRGHVSLCDSHTASAFGKCSTWNISKFATLDRSEIAKRSTWNTGSIIRSAGSPCHPSSCLRSRLEERSSLKFDVDQRSTWNTIRDSLSIRSKIFAVFHVERCASLRSHCRNAIGKLLQPVWIEPFGTPFTLH